MQTILQAGESRPFSPVLLGPSKGARPPSLCGTRLRAYSHACASPVPRPDHAVLHTILIVRKLRMNRKTENASQGILIKFSADNICAMWIGKEWQRDEVHADCSIVGLDLHVPHHESGDVRTEGAWHEVNACGTYSKVPAPMGVRDTERHDLQNVVGCLFPVEGGHSCQVAHKMEDLHQKALATSSFSFRWSDYLHGDICGVHQQSYEWGLAGSTHGQNPDTHMERSDPDTPDSERDGHLLYLYCT